MKIQFACSSCGAKYQADPQSAGQKGKCKHCGTAIEVPQIIHDSFPQSAEKASGERSKTNRTKRLLGKTLKIFAVSVVIIATLASAAKYGYNYYRISQLKQKLEEAIGKNAGYTETIIKVEAEASGMTYKELFDLCDKSIEDRTTLIVELRGLYPDIDYELKEKLIEFLNHENELTRSKRAFYRHQLDLSSSTEILQEHLADTPSSSYGWDYYRKRSNSLKNDLLEAISEIISSADNFKSNYLELVEQESNLTSSMSAENIRFPTIFKQYEESNIKLADETKTTAELMKKNLI